MAVCFTIGELYALAEQLQVPQTPAWSNSPQDASRDICRHFERSGALAFLVEALVSAKPLVEWPEPLPAPAALPLPLALPPAPPPSAAPAPASASSPAALFPAPTLVGPGPALPPAHTIFAQPSPHAVASPAPAEPAASETSDRPTPIAAVSAANILATASAGFAPATMPRPGEAPAPSATAADVVPASAAVVPASADVVSASAAGPTIPDPHAPPASLRPAAAWPGTARPASKAAPAQKSLDPRILLGAGAAVLIAAVAVAFLVGRASSAAEPASGGATATPLPTDHAPIAALAAGALSDSLQRVAKACQIEVASLRGRSLFEVAYRRCGPPPPPTSDPRAILAPYAPLPADDDDDPPAPADSKKPRPNRLQKADTGPSNPPPVAGTNCLAGCSKDHRSCTAKCGAEPKQSSLYDAYQSCLGGCLKAASRCKMACQ